MGGTIKVFVIKEYNDADYLPLLVAHTNNFHVGIVLVYLHQILSERRKYIILEQWANSEKTVKRIIHEMDAASML